MCQQREKKISKRKLKYQEEGAPKKKRKLGGGPDKYYGAHDFIPNADKSKEDISSLCEHFLT